MLGLDLANWQIIAIFCVFIWGGFCRGAFSFGGAALSLPILVMIYPDPLFFLPVIAIHLLFFGAFSIIGKIKHVDWGYLKKLLIVLLPTKIIGILGLLQLPADVLIVIIYSFSLFYAFNYLLLRHFTPRSRFVEMFMLMLGGYMSGTALSGAPVIVAVAARHIKKENLRTTLFVLWCTLVILKLMAMSFAGISLQWAQHVWLLPAAAIGHVIGARFHGYLLGLGDNVYYRMLGLMLLLLGVSGFSQLIFLS